MVLAWQARARLCACTCRACAALLFAPAACLRAAACTLGGWGAPPAMKQPKSKAECVRVDSQTELFNPEAPSRPAPHPAQPPCTLPCCQRSLPAANPACAPACLPPCFASLQEKAAELDGAEVAGGWLKVDLNPGSRTPGSGGRGGRGGGRFDGGRGRGGRGGRY